MITIAENALVARLASGFRRSPLQLNGLSESDAELVRLPGTHVLLAFTTDAIVEEIELGLYTDPYLIGWMTVMVNASDLAAVGAEPLGILLSVTLPPELEDELVSALQRGIQDACAICGLHVLGGDTNFSSGLRMEGSAVGIVPDGAPVTRRRCWPGDRLYASGPLGLGAAYALAQLGPEPRVDALSLTFRPVARIREGQLLRRFATCCMDTSDGALATLDELMRLNEVGFVLHAPVESYLHPDALGAAGLAGIPGWMTLAAPHGEFELLFTVPDADCAEFLRAARSIDWAPIEIGRVVSEPGVKLPIGGGLRDLDTARVRNLFHELEFDIGACIVELHRLAAA